MKKTVFVVLLIMVSALLAALDYGLYVQSSAGNEIHIVDRDSEGYAGTYTLQGGSASALVPTPGGVSVYALSDNNTRLEAFSAEDGQAQEQFSDGWENIAGFAFTPTGDRLFILDKGAGALLIYKHQRLTLEHSLSVDFPIGGSGDIAFNGRGTRYFALGNEGGKSLLLSGDAVNGRIQDRIVLGFEAENLLVSDNDRFAWVSGTGQLAVIDLRRGRIVRKIRGEFKPESLVLEKRGKRAIVLNAHGDGVAVFNSQNGKKITDGDLPDNYRGLLLDENDQAWLVPDSTAEPFSLLAFTGNRDINTEAISLRSLPSGLDISQAVLSSVKRGGNFACF